MFTQYYRISWRDREKEGPRGKREGPILLLHTTLQSGRKRASCLCNVPSHKKSTALHRTRTPKKKPTVITRVLLAYHTISIMSYCAALQPNIITLTQTKIPGRWQVHIIHTPHSISLASFEGTELRLDNFPLLFMPEVFL